MKSYNLTFLYFFLTGHYSKTLFKYTAREKQDVFMKTSKKVWALLKKLQHILKQKHIKET